MAALVTLQQVIMRIKMTNMSPLNDYFGGISKARFYPTKKIKWQIVDVDNSPSSFHSLTQKAKIIDKSGHSYLEMTPPTINEGIVRDSYSEDGLKAGELAEVRPGMDSGLNAEAYKQLETAVVLTRRYKNRLIVGAGEALGLGGITINKDGDKLYYDIPATQKHSLDWSLAATSRISDLDDMVEAARLNDENPTRLVFGQDTYSSFLAGDDILEGNTSEGKGQNFRYANITEAQRESGYYIVGSVRLKTGWYDIYLWNETYKTDAGATAYFYSKTAISLTSPGMGGLVYGALNVANDSKKQVEWKAAEFFAKEGEKTGGSDDNPEYKDIFKSAPACIIADGKKLSIADVTVA